MGGPKALLRFDDGTTLLERQTSLLIEGGCARVGIVIGAFAPEIRVSHPAIPARWIINERWEMGQFTSLQAGIAGSLSTDAGGAMVLPVDVAGISSDVVTAIIDTALRNPHLDAVVPEYGGRGGHPVYLSRSFCTLLAGLDPADSRSRLDTQLALLANAIRIPVNNPNVAKNINTQEEWETMKLSS